MMFLHPTPRIIGFGDDQPGIPREPRIGNREGGLAKDIVGMTAKAVGEPEQAPQPPGGAGGQSAEMRMHVADPVRAQHWLDPDRLEHSLRVSLGPMPWNRPMRAPSQFPRSAPRID